MIDWQIATAWALVLAAVLVVWALLALAAFGVYRLVS